MKERLLYIDRLKGFAIFLVVLGHLIQNNSIDHYSNSLFNIIYSFHMPFFFFLSGYVAFKTTKIDSVNSYIGYIKNKAITLLVPMLIWPLVNQFFFTNSTDYSLNSIAHILFTQIENPGLWFLKMLFQILIIYSLFYFMSVYVNKKMSFLLDVAFYLILTFSLVLFSYLLNDKSILTFLLNFSFFMIGVFISKFDFIKVILEHQIITSILAISFALLVRHFDFTQTDLGIMKGLKVVISLSAIGLFYSIAKKIVLPIWLDRYVCLMGRKSLIIYVTHFSFFSILSKSMLLPADISFLLLLIIIMPLSIIMMSFCVGIGNLVALLPYVNLMLYGVRIKK
jgi:fucose 4-O-acetylase-like acetyltransferase